MSKRLSGEQLPYIERPADEASFDVFLCDGALIGTPDGMRLLTDADLKGDGPIPGYVRDGLSTAERMANRFDLKPRFYDLRTPEGRARASAAREQEKFLKSASEIGA